MIKNRKQEHKWNLLQTLISKKIAFHKFFRKNSLRILIIVELFSMQTFVPNKISMNEWNILRKCVSFVAVRLRGYFNCSGWAGLFICLPPPPVAPIKLYGANNLRSVDGASQVFGLQTMILGFSEAI